MDVLRNIKIRWRWLKMRLKSEKEPFSYREIREDPLLTAVCVDLGAFPRPLPFLPGIDTVVIMENRSPEFFLGYDEYNPKKIVPLSLHGPLNNYRTQEDLRELVSWLQQQGKKVLIGFWGFWADGASRKPAKWLQKHPELKPRRKDESDIGNPFAVLNPEDITFARYVADQYRKLHHSFGFNGLFLGDGLCGFRSFWHPERYNDKFAERRSWVEFYWTIAQAVHVTGGNLWAYDCMGFSYSEALKHGADYKLLAQSGLDVLVFQSYPTAWARFFKIPGKTGLSKDFKNFLSIKEMLSNEPIKLYYSLEMGDSREGWLPSYGTNLAQMGVFRFLAKADGKFLVWGNETIANLGAER